MSRLMRRPRLLLVGVFLLGALLVGSSVVVAATINSGGAVTAVKVATEGEVTSVGTKDVWTDVAGMSLGINVPSGERALLLITFSAESMCRDYSGTSASCSIRVLVDGRDVHPGVVIFDSARDGPGWETNSMQFVHSPAFAGAHTIKVLAQVSESQSALLMMARTLTVLRSRM